MRARVRVPADGPGPGRLAEVNLDAEICDGRLCLRGLDVADVRTRLPEGDLRFEPAGGGGPLVQPEEETQARCFGVVNVAFHLQHALRWSERLLGRDLPPLVVRIGTHAPQRPRWAGGHYRLPAERYSELPEPDPPAPTGEIHLGCGGAYLPFELGRYFDAPAHNPAILYHELGHHICRHTADFRLNARRPQTRQANRKIPLDEGTCDYIAATLTGCPDIFGWHRRHVPNAHPGRRRLDTARTMADFRGGSDQDPHGDGAVWAAALWSARCAVLRSDCATDPFDRILLAGLDRIGRSNCEVEWDEALRRRRHFSRALAALLASIEEQHPSLLVPVAQAFAAHGIVTGASNRELRDRSRGLRNRGLTPVHAHRAARTT
jgi:hypothetical protein